MERLIDTDESVKQSARAAWEAELERVYAHSPVGTFAHEIVEPDAVFESEQASAEWNAIVSPPSEFAHHVEYGYWQKLENAFAARKFSAAEIGELRWTFHYVSHLFRNEFRKSNNQPFTEHLSEVARYVTEWGGEVEHIQAALLHDAIEDIGETVASLTALFGSKVAHIVDGLSEVRGHDERVNTILSQNQVFGLMELDYFAPNLKLGDRLHNMRTLSGLPEHKRYAKALETLNVYVPLALRMGLPEVAEELTERSLEYVLIPEVLEEVHLLHAKRRAFSLDEQVREYFTFLFSDSAYDIDIKPPGYAKIWRYLSEQARDPRELTRSDVLQADVPVTVQIVVPIYHKARQGLWPEHVELCLKALEIFDHISSESHQLFKKWLEFSTKLHIPAQNIRHWVDSEKTPIEIDIMVFQQAQREAATFADYIWDGKSQTGHREMLRDAATENLNCFKYTVKAMKQIAGAGSDEAASETLNAALRQYFWEGGVLISGPTTGIYYGVPYHASVRDAAMIIDPYLGLYSTDFTIVNARNVQKTVSAAAPLKQHDQIFCMVNPHNGLTPRSLSEVRTPYAEKILRKEIQHQLVKESTDPHRYVEQTLTKRTFDYGFEKLRDAFDQVAHENDSRQPLMILVEEVENVYERFIQNICVSDEENCWERFDASAENPLIRKSINKQNLMRYLALHDDMEAHELIRQIVRKLFDKQKEWGFIDAELLDVAGANEEITGIIGSIDDDGISIDYAAQDVMQSPIAGVRVMRYWFDPDKYEKVVSEIERGLFKSATKVIALTMVKNEKSRKNKRVIITELPYPR